MNVKSVVRIVLIGLFGFLLSAAPTPAQAADLTDYGLNYKNEAAVGAKWVGVSYRVDGFKK